MSTVNLASDLLSAEVLSHSSQAKPNAELKLA